MPYVQRNQSGLIVGIYENLQPGIAEEFVESPELGKSYSVELAELNAKYQADVAKFNSSFALALLSDGPSEATKLATIRAQYEARRTKHAADLAELKAQYGV